MSVIGYGTEGCYVPTACRLQTEKLEILQRRAARKLHALRQMVLDWGDAKYSANRTHGQTEQMEGETEQLERMDEVKLTVDRVSSVKFPTYVAPNVKDDMVRYMTMSTHPSAEFPCV